MSTYCYLGNERYINATQKRLEDAGYERVEDAAKANFVITFYTSLTALEEAYFGDNGLIEVMSKGSVAIDISAGTPNLSSEICSVATVSDLVMVCAPLGVKNKLAQDAFARVNTYCYAGSEDDGVQRAMPVLDILFGDIRPVADAGAAQLSRTARTIQNTSEMVSAIESLSLFAACSKSVASDVDVVSLAPNATSPEAYFILEAVKEKRFYGEYTVEMLLAEISATMMTADDFETILPQIEAAFHLYELLAIIGGADMSPAALALVYEGEPAQGEGVCGEDAQSEGANGHESGGIESGASREGASTCDYGLDWSRVEQVYGTSDHDHDHASGHGEYNDQDYFGEDFDDDFPDDFAEDYGFSVN